VRGHIREDRDPGETNPALALAAADPKLGRLIARVGEYRLRKDAARSPFESLTRAIVHQQLTGKVAETILGRVMTALAAGRMPTPVMVLAAPEATLRSAGLSRSKIAALRDLAAKTASGELPPLARLRRLDDEAVIETLTTVRGIGRWTAEMFLIFKLGRQDVLPVGDFGVRKGFGLVFKRGRLPEPDEVGRRGERWRPFRTAAAWYLWRAAEAAPRASVLLDSARES
jgi:DNA-3-methyladenine glycosylase II